ncbi:MAG TPA: hypothetical protein VGC42_24795 [Kofleriaceae bacterium]
MKTYLDANKQASNVIHVTPHDEHEILSALHELPDSVKAKVMTEGVRSAFPRIFGMRTVWDAEQTRVDHESASPVGFR